MKAFLYPEGSRVRVRRGRYPIDPSLVGREGVVRRTDQYRPRDYEVVLDGESRGRTFDEGELEPVSAADVAEPRPEAPDPA